MDALHPQNYKTELEGVKAPLGVILYLIKRDNLDIYNIPIAKITRDYVEYLDLMEEMHIDLAGEFFVLAATLMRIKVQMLLRRDSDEDDPREELVRNLVEYKKMVEAARALRDREEERRNVYPRPVPQNEKEYREDPVFDLNLFEIMRAFREVIAGFGSIEDAEIILEEFSIEDKEELIDQLLGDKGQVRFIELFQNSSSRLEVVVTFMALLEMMKQLRVTARQEGAFGEIWVYKFEAAPQPQFPSADAPGIPLASSSPSVTQDHEADNTNSGSPVAAEEAAPPQQERGEDSA